MDTKFRIVLLGVSTLETVRLSGRIEVEFSVFVLRLRRQPDGRFLPADTIEECNEQGHYYNMASDLHALMWDWTCVFEDSVAVLATSTSIPSENVLHGRGKLAASMHIRCRVPRGVPLLKDGGFDVKLSPSGGARPVMNPHEKYELVSEPPPFSWKLNLCASPVSEKPMQVLGCSQTLHSLQNIKRRYPRGAQRWLEHHLKAGVGNMHIYDVDGSFADDVLPYEFAGTVSYFERFPETVAPELIYLAQNGCELGAEQLAMDHCLQRARGRSVWGATIFAPHYYLRSQDPAENEFVGQANSLSSWLRKEAWEPWVVGYTLASWPMGGFLNRGEDIVSDDPVERFVHAAPEERRLANGAVKAGLVFFRPLASEVIDCHRLIPKPGDYIVVDMPPDIWRGNWYADFLTDESDEARCPQCSILDTTLRDQTRVLDGMVDASFGFADRNADDDGAE